MNPYFNSEEMNRRCRNPNFCIVCFRIRNNVKVDEHHVCGECRKGSKGSYGMPRRLPVITLKNGKSYFVDNRLRELRNIHKPYDSLDFRELMQSRADLLP